MNAAHGYVSPLHWKVRDVLSCQAIEVLYVDRKSISNLTIPCPVLSRPAPMQNVHAGVGRGGFW